MKILVLIIALSCWFFLANGRQKLKVLQSNVVVQDSLKGVHKHDALHPKICKQLRSKGFCKRSIYVKKRLCHATCRDSYLMLGCDNILSHQTCDFLKKHSECSKGYTVPRYCRWTCGFCSAHLGTCKVTALGMQSRAIPDSRITASTIHGSKYAAHQGRLHYRSYYRPTRGKAGSWCSKTSRVGEYLQVDLGKAMTVLGVATQGRYDHNEWVRSYSLKYSNNGSTFKNYQGGRVFTGNKDRNSVVKHIVYPPIVARFVRVEAKTWYRHICMRMELYGCKI